MRSAILRVLMMSMLVVCADAQTPDVTLLGTIQGANGLPAANTILSFTPTQTFFVQGSGTSVTGVSSFSGDGVLSTNADSTGAVTLTLANASQNSVFGGPCTGGAGLPTYQVAPCISAQNMSSFPTLNQNTTGNAATSTNTSEWGGVFLGGTPSAGQTIVATSPTAAVWSSATGGTVTSVSATGTNGITVVVTNATTTPAIAIGLSGVPTLAGNNTWTGANVFTGATTMGSSTATTEVEGSLVVQNVISATSGANQNSPAFTVGGQYWTGSASATDQWTWQDVISSGLTPTSIFTLSHSAPSGALGAPTVDMTAAISVTVNELVAQTAIFEGAGGLFVSGGPSTLQLANIGNQAGGGIAGTTNTSSPDLNVNGTYTNGTVTFNDGWTIQNVLPSSGANPLSTLTYSHSGSPGGGQVSIPYPVSTGALTPTSLSIASGHVYTRHTTVSCTLSPTSVGANTLSAQGLTCTGIHAGDFILGTNPPTFTNYLTVAYYSSTANTIVAIYTNPTAAAVAPPVGTYVFDVEQ